MSLINVNKIGGDGERGVSWLWPAMARYGAIFVLVAMIVVFAAIDPERFLSVDNMINIFNQSALTAIIAMGLTFALVSGDFDLSIGYVASFGGILAAWFMVDQGWAILPAAGAALVGAALVGYVNGLLVTRIGINALVATLGVGTVVLGLNYAITGGIPAVIDNETFLDFTINKLWGVPYPVYVMIVVAILLWVCLNRTPLGKAMQAVGGNRTAAEFSGIRVSRVREICFVITAVSAAVTGILLASQSGSATMDGGQSYLLSAYAAVFFGSAVLRDGQFHVVGTLIGVLTVAVGFNGIAIIGIESYYQYVFQGMLLILAVGLGSIGRRIAER